MDKAKKNLAASQENKAVATGDLDTTSKDLAEDISTKSTLHEDCMAAAEDFSPVQVILLAVLTLIRRNVVSVSRGFVKHKLQRKITLPASQRSSVVVA